MLFGCRNALRPGNNRRMNHLSVPLLLGLAVTMAFSPGCRRRKPATVTSETPVVQEPASPAPAAAAAPESPSNQATVAPANADTFQTSTEFEDLTKDFQLYCNYKKRVPTDINEFFRDQKIKPPAIPPGTRLAIDRENRRIILVK